MSSTEKDGENDGESDDDICSVCGATLDKGWHPTHVKMEWKFIIPTIVMVAIIVIPIIVLLVTFLYSKFSSMLEQ